MKKNLIVPLLFALSHPANALDLIETYHLAIETDPKLKSSYLKQYSVGESKIQSIAQMLPAISVTGNSSRDRLNNRKITFQGAGVQNYWNHGFTVNFSQPVFHWEHWVQLSQSQNRIAQAESEHQIELHNLIVRTTETYFNILAAQDNLDFTKSEKKAIERQLEQAQQRFDVGLIAITDVYEAQAGYDQAVANQIEAENLLFDSKEALIEIIGENEINLLPLARDIPLSPPVPNDLSAWTANAKTNNLNIVAALNQAEVNRKNISIQQSGHLPTLDIVANYNVQDVNSTFGLRGDTQSVGLQLNIPLFQGGLISSRAKQAQFDYQIARENLLSVKRSVKRQVRNSFRDVTSTLSRTHALKAAVISANSAVEASEAGFEVGSRTMVDVLSEQRNLYRAKRDYSRSRYDYLINSIKLKQAASSLSEQDLYLINHFLEFKR